LIVLIVLLLLRVADRAHQTLTSKRTRRGPRPADIAGVIESKLVQNGQPVEYGEGLFAIRAV